MMMIDQMGPRVWSLRGMVLLVSLLAAIACGSDRATGPGTDQRIAGMILESQDRDYIYSHTDHWHGAPILDAGDTVTYLLHFFRVGSASDDHDAPPRDQWFVLPDTQGNQEYGVRVVVADETIARWEGDRATGRLIGVAAGASRISFVVRRGATTLYESPPLNFRVR